jgi:hypothetical protein
MADYRSTARRAAARYGLDPDIFTRQIQQESGFNPTARSGAGAIGIAQIMPATARGWGVDPTDPVAALNAAAKHMAGYVKQYGSYRNALVAYNAGPGRVGGSLPSETQHYIATILGGANPKNLSATRAPAAPSATPTAAPTTEVAPALLKLTTPQRPQIQITAPTAPSFAAAPVTPGGAQLPPTPAPRQPRLDMGAALEAITALQPAQQVQASGAGAVSPSRVSAPASGGNGKFTISGPNPGRLQPGVTAFAKRVANQLGGTLTGLDGSTHSKYTVNGNISEHYSGNATDIFKINGKPAQGKRLLQAGRAALIAAGMPPAKAMKQTGGLYNVGSHQIIFLTNEGGNHYDHLHISTHAKR